MKYIGSKEENIQYIKRPGSYAIIINKNDDKVGIVTVNYANHGGKSSAYSPIVRNINKHELNSEMLVMNDKEDIKII